MDEQELNKKLAEWVGVDSFPIYPTGYDYPDFTQSLDACFKWLVPRLAEWSISNKERDEGEVLPYAEIGYRNDSNKWSYFEEWAETPSLALCLAIEKLIDKEVKV